MKCARINKGSDENPEIRCSLVAQELGFCERLDEMFAGTPSLTIVKLLLSVAIETDLTLMLPDVKCAFLYGDMRRNMYIKLPRQAPRLGDCMTMGKLRKFE